MTHHFLKCDPEPFEAVWGRRKTVEVRNNDRGYAVGDILTLNKTKHSADEMRNGAPLEYTGDVLIREVTHVLSNYGMLPGYVALSLGIARCPIGWLGTSAWDGL